MKMMNKKNLIVVMVVLGTLFCVSSQAAEKAVVAQRVSQPTTLKQKLFRLCCRCCCCCTSSASKNTVVRVASKKVPYGLDAGILRLSKPLLTIILQYYARCPYDTVHVLNPALQSKSGQLVQFPIKAVRFASLDRTIYDAISSDEAVIDLSEIDVWATPFAPDADGRDSDFVWRVSRLNPPRLLQTPFQPMAPQVIDTSCLREPTASVEFNDDTTFSVGIPNYKQGGNVIEFCITTKETMKKHKKILKGLQAMFDVSDEQLAKDVSAQELRHVAHDAMLAQEPVEKKEKDKA